MDVSSDAERGLEKNCQVLKRKLMFVVDLLSEAQCFDKLHISIRMPFLAVLHCYSSSTLQTTRENRLVQISAGTGCFGPMFLIQHIANNKRKQACTDFCRNWLLWASVSLRWRLC